MFSAAAAARAADLYKVDVKLCYPFIEALVNTMRIQCSMTAKAGKPLFMTPELAMKTDVLINANIATDKVQASVNVCMSKKVFLPVMSKMLGEKFLEITPDLEDGAQKLTNIIFSQAGKPLANKGMSAVRSIPVIIFGDDMRMRYLCRGQPIFIPFETEAGTMSIQISTQEVSQSDKI